MWRTLLKRPALRGCLLMTSSAAQAGGVAWEPLVGLPGAASASPARRITPSSRGGLCSWKFWCTCSLAREATLAADVAPRVGRGRAAGRAATVPFATGLCNSPMRKGFTSAETQSDTWRWKF